MVYMFKKKMLENKHFTITSKKCEVGNILPANSPEWEISRFFQKKQVRRRQIGEAIIFKRPKLAL